MREEDGAFGEARSLVTIMAVVVGAGLWVMGQREEWVRWILDWVAGVMEGWVPVVGVMPMELVGAVVIGVGVWILGIGFSGVIGRWLGGGGLERLEGQTRALEAKRKKMDKKRRERDKFEVE